MRKRILDTSVLITHWRRNYNPSQSPDAKDAAAWAGNLIEAHDGDAIVTPIRLEFIVGTRTGQELTLAESYLGRFRCVDNGEVTGEDWLNATRIARRVPRDGRPRDLGDCLIRAIAGRLKYEVITGDRRFAR